MADQDRDEPSLELPSLRFGRRRKRKKAAAAGAAAEAEPTTEAQPEPEAAREPEPEPEPQPLTRSDEDTSATTVLDDPLSGPHQLAPSEPAADTRVEPAAGEASEQGRPLFADETAPEEDDDTIVAAQEPPTEDDQPASAGERRGRRRRISLPSIGGMPAAIITGVLVGALTVGLTAAALRGCEAVKGTSSCGGPGLLLLAAILVLGILLGAFLLRVFGVSDPGSTSFLAVGLLAVVTLLFLMDALFMWWIVIVVPALAVVTFALAHWVTVAFIEPGES